MSQLRNFVGHLLCAVILVTSGFVLVFVFPLPPSVSLAVYVGLVMPISITSGMMIHPLTYKGLLVISGSQFLAVAWFGAMSAAAWHGVYGGGLQFSDLIEVAVVSLLVTMPLLLLQCAWLYAWKYQRKAR